MPTRTSTNDKSLISDESFKADQSLASLRALIKFALFQIDHSRPEEFIALREEWGTMLRLMQEKIDLACESNSEIAFLAATYVPKEARH